MKPIKLFLIAMIAIIAMTASSCSSTNNEDTTIAVPVPATSLSGTNSASAQVTLTWKDNSTNETGFKIERKTGTEFFSIIGTTKTDVPTYVDTNITNGVNYTYRVYPYNSAGNSPTYSNEFKITPYGLPVLTTTPITLSATTSSIITGGNITDDSGLFVNSRGVIWSTNTNPTISLSTKTLDGSGTGNYTSTTTTLLPDTTYYIRAYATNSKGVAYGNEIIYKTPPIFTIGGGITDICGNSYPTIVLKGKEWMQKNLDVCKYRNGDPIPQVQDITQWGNLTTGAWCYYENKTENGIVYGKLYNGYALNDPRGIAPVGWHVSSSTEWDDLLLYLGGQTNIVAEKLREKGKVHWTSNTTNTNNESGFTALPSGQINYYFGKPNTTPYTGIGLESTFWTTISKGPYYMMSISANGYYNENSFSSGSSYANSGHSIRCVKD